MKKLFLTFFSLIFVFSFLVPNIVIAQEVGVVPTTGSPNKCDIEFIPNISIPGSDFLKAEKGVCINSDSIGYYIVALYKYGAGFAGIVAMFMLVFAGWQWLMAAGRADQISKAKDTIVSVFVGLALLFGGYLLMSQISENSVNFKDIGLDYIPVEGLNTHEGDDCCLLKDENGRGLRLVYANISRSASETCNSVLGEPEPPGHNWIRWGSGRKRCDIAVAECEPDLESCISDDDCRDTRECKTLMGGQSYKCCR